MDGHRVLKEMYIGIAIVDVFFMLLGIIVMRPYFLFAVGILVGGICACLEVRHMFYTLDRALDLQAKNARGFVTSRSFMRLGANALILIVAYYINWVTFVGATIGLISIKISAFLNPFIRKVLNKDYKGE